MYIYRCAKRGDFDRNCIYVEPLVGDNSHKYEDGTEYIHFFRYAKDAEYFFRRNIQMIKGSEYHVGYTIVEVDENEILKFLGYGIYVIGEVLLEKNKNLHRPLLEYAIPKKLFDEFDNKYFFRVREQYAENIDDEIYYDKIPDEFRNDNEHEEYLNFVNELCVKHNADPNLIGEEQAYQIGEEILELCRLDRRKQLRYFKDIYRSEKIWK